MSLLGQPPYLGAYYDGDADIAWFPQGKPLAKVISEEQPWGLIDRDSQDGSVIGVEIWNAREALGDLVDQLPRPSSRGAENQ